MVVLIDAAEDDQAVLSGTLIEALVCPIDHANLRLTGNTLVCTRCERVYPIEDGLPNMLVDGV